MILKFIKNSSLIKNLAQNKKLNFIQKIFFLKKKNQEFKAQIEMSFYEVEKLPNWLKNSRFRFFGIPVIKILNLGQQQEKYDFNFIRTSFSCQLRMQN
jgi:hypothetical protein